MCLDIRLRARLEQSTTTPVERIANDGMTNPTIEELSENRISSVGLDESQHTPNKPRIGCSMTIDGPDNSQHSSKARNSRDPPTGPRVWREKIARTLQRSMQSKSQKQN
jgi:hypothetical protein